MFEQRQKEEKHVSAYFYRRYCSEFVFEDKVVEQHVFVISAVFLWDKVWTNVDFRNNSDMIDNPPWVQNDV